MTEFRFYLSEEDAARLFAVKKLQGKDGLTGNEFARQLLELELYHLFPAVPELDERGRLVNADRYRGRKNPLP